MMLLAVEAPKWTDVMSAWGQVGGAVATFAAVLFALWATRRDSRRLALEQESRAFAQASLVIVEFAKPEPDGVNDHITKFRVKNLSDYPILEARAAIWVTTDLDATKKGELAPERSAPGVPARVIRRDGIHVFDWHTVFRAPRDVWAWRVSWTDHDGCSWRVDGIGHRPVRGKHLDPPESFRGRDYSEKTD